MAKNTPCSCGCGDTISTCKCPSSCSCRKPGGSCYKHKNNKEKAADMEKYSLEDMLKNARCWAGYEPVPGKKPYSNNSCRPVSSGKKKNKKEEKKAELAPDDAEDMQDLKRRQDAYKKAPSWKKVIFGRDLLSDSPYLDLDERKWTGGEKKREEKSASTPAWQRSEGKNEAGGLNEKGRKSYEREHGGNLQAPVTQKNPKGKAKKRQNSFCARMCGMKRVNTGASTAKDPDSRINKSLRKWNCKCSSAELFGQSIAGLTELTEKEAWLGAVLGAGGRLAAKALPAAAKAVAPAARTAAPAAAQAVKATAAPVASTSRALATGAAQATKAAPKITITPQQAASAVPLPKSPGLVTPAPRTMQPPPLPVKPGMSGPALERTTGRILDATGRPVPMKAPPPVPAAPTAPKVTISPAEAAAGRSAMKITPQDMASSMWEGTTGQGRRQMMGAAANADIPGIHNMPFNKLSPEMQRTVMQAMGYAQ